MVYFQKALISLKLLPLKLSNNGTKVNYDFLNWRFLFWLSIRVGLTAVFIYSSLFVCPPDEWNVLSIVIVVLTIFGMSASILFPFMFAEAYVRNCPYSLRCKSELSTKQWIFLVTTNALFFVAFAPIALPQLLNCSANMLSCSIIIGTVTLLIVMATFEFLICSTIVCAWMNQMVDNCETVLDQKSPTLAKIKDVLCQYETLRVAVRFFVFQMFTAPQIVLILAVYIATAGTVDASHFFTRLFNYRFFQGTPTTMQAL